MHRGNEGVRLHGREDATHSIPPPRGEVCNDSRGAENHVETEQHTPRSPLVGEHANPKGFAVRGQRLCRVKKIHPLTLPATRLARKLDALPLRYLSAARKIAAESPLPQEERGRLWHRSKAGRGLDD